MIDAVKARSLTFANGPQTEDEVVLKLAEEILASADKEITGLAQQGLFMCSLYIGRDMDRLDFSRKELLLKILDHRLSILGFRTSIYGMNVTKLQILWD